MIDEFDIPDLTEEDFKKMVKNPFVSKFTPEDKFKAYLKSFIAEYGWTKEHIREEVDAALA